MRKLVLSTFLALPALLFAECLSSDEAQSIAEAFFSNAQTSVYKSAAEAPQVNLVWDGEEPVYKRAGADDADASTVSDPAFYVFNKEDGKGFVIVSGETATDQPILGYSLDQSFEVNDMPENVYGWMMGYKKEIQMARENSYVGNSPSIKAGEFNPMEPIKLLETALWDQGYPFNSKLPKDYQTGCPATAASIIMRYHQWPDKGVGTIPVVNKYIGAVELGHLYDWTNMPIVCTKDSKEEEKAQVGTIMRDAGVMLRTSYTAVGSGAMPDEFMPRFLPIFFKYDAKTIKTQLKKDFTDSVWHEMMKKELDENRPVMYAGVDYNLKFGHIFVMDGYAENNYYHFNWGWSGKSNGYYLLTALTPSDFDGNTFNLNNDQYAVIGIQPDKTNPGGGDYDLLEYSQPTKGGQFGIIPDRSDIEQNKEFKVSLREIINRGTGDFKGELALAHFEQHNTMKNVICDPLNLAKHVLHVNDPLTIRIMCEVTQDIEPGDFISAIYRSSKDMPWMVMYPGDTNGFNAKYAIVLKESKVPTTVEEPVVSTVRVMGDAGKIQVEGLTEMTAVAVYSLNGQLVASTQAESTAKFELPADQIYIVKVGDQSWKVKL